MDEFETELMAAVGAKIAAAREAAGMSQQALGSATGVSKVFISNLENGLRKANLAHIVRIADALNVHPAALLPEPKMTPEVAASFLAMGGELVKKR